MTNNGDSGYNRKFEKLVGKAWPDSGKSRESVFGPTDDSPSSQDPAMNDFVADVWDIIDELGNLLISKQRDYGPGNINNAFGGPMNDSRTYSFSVMVNHSMNQSKIHSKT